MRLALAAASLGNMNDATRRLDEVIGRCGDDPQPEVRAYAVSALIYKGFMFGQNGSPQQGLACYGSVVERYGADPAEVIRNVVAQARSRRAAVLEQLGDTEGALADYGAIIGDGPLSPGTTPWRERARELLNRGFLLQALGRWEEAEVDFRRLVADYADLATGEMELWVARAKVNRVRRSLGAVGRLAQPGHAAGSGRRDVQSRELPAPSRPEAGGGRRLRPSGRPLRG
jgi:tetratricopeptide (TPR) repeat protein